MPSPNAAALKKQLFCKVRDERLAAVPLVAALPKEEALPLLRRGAGHWDRDLRRQCATALVKLGGIGEADRLSALAKKGLLPHAVRGVVDCQDTDSGIRRRRDPQGTTKPDRIESQTCSPTLSGRTQPPSHCGPSGNSFAARRSWRRSGSARPRGPRSRPKRPRGPGRRLRSSRQWCDYQGLKDATGARPELLKALFGTWTKDNHCFSEMYERHRDPEASRRHAGDPGSGDTAQGAPAGHPRQPSLQGPSPPGLPRLPRGLLDLDQRRPARRARRRRQPGPPGLLPNAHESAGSPGLFEQLEVPGGVLGRRFLVDAVTFEGKLPQGAPTSPAIANLIARRLDSRLAGLAAKIGATYTRYADDLTLSGTTAVLSSSPEYARLSMTRDSSVAEEKTRVLRRAFGRT